MKLDLRLTILAVAAGVAIFNAGTSFGEWPSDPTINVPLSRAVGNQGQNGLSGASDGMGGAIIAWTDVRTGDEDIFAQRVDGNGMVRWTLDGVAVCDIAGWQRFPRVVSDGAGGAIIVWTDLRNGASDIYAQRLGSNGELLWPTGAPSTNGVAVVTAFGNQVYLDAVSDDAGGAILIWSNVDNSVEGLYAQRLNAEGEIQWPTGAPSLDGLAICTEDGVQIFPSIASDGAGGAVIAWEDGRNASTTNYDIYAQRVGSDGSGQWTSGGVEVCRAPVGQIHPMVASDGAGGAIVAWEDRRVRHERYLYAQRINSFGSDIWTLDGVLVSESFIDGQYGLAIAADGDGGAILVWEDQRDYGVSKTDLFAQRLAATGMELWTSGGVPVSAALEDQEHPVLMVGPTGHAVVAWTENRNETVDVYAQRLDPDGNADAPADGQPVATAVSYQGGPIIVGTGAGGGVAAWPDSRDYATTGIDIYVQAVFKGVIFVDDFESGDLSGWSGGS